MIYLVFSTEQASEGTHIGSVRLFPMINRFFLSGTRSLCDGSCKEKPRSQDAAQQLS